MPNAMLVRVQCDQCNSVLPRGSMSPFTGICDQCFIRAYTYCFECAALVRINGRTQNVHYLIVDSISEPFCDRCWHSRRHRSEAGVFHWWPTPLDTSIATYKRIRSKRKYGVEVETSQCTNFEQLYHKTKFGCKTDCSIYGREFDSPILYGDEGFAEIEALLEFGAKQNWDVDSDCGCHTHYDARDESDIALYRIAYAYVKTYDFWRYSVSNYRRDSSYCHTPSYTCRDIRRSADRSHSFQNFSRHRDRYDYVNIGAYNTHVTFENRLLEGTIDAETICNWVTLHARFMDYVGVLSFDDLDHLFSGRPKHILSALIRVADESSLSDWLVTRIDEHSPGALD